MVLTVLDKASVQDQYEAYPYPEPIDDLKSFIKSGQFVHSDPSIDPYNIWPEGHRKRLNILVAGCGTFEAAYFAYKNPKCHVTGIDISQTSLEETRRLKKSWQPGIAWGLAASATIVPEPWREPLAEVFYRKASAVVSNVPGTPEARYIAGCRITEQMFWVPQAGDIGLGISIVSYAGQVQFGVVADEAVMADPEDFLNDCLQELAQFPGD